MIPLIVISAIVIIALIVAYRADIRMMKKENKVREMQAFGAERKEYNEFLKRSKK